MLLGKNRYLKYFDMLQNAVIKGDVKAMYGLGLMFYEGREVEQDDVEAVEWWRKAVAWGNAGAMYNLGLMYAGGQGVGQDDGEAVRWLQKAARKGEMKAQEILRKWGESW